MRVLFVAIPERGHLVPLVAVAARLERDGNEVGFLSHGDVSATLAAAGVAARTFGTGRTEAEKRGAVRPDDVVWLARWFKMGTVAVLGAGMLHAVDAAIEAFAPDVMVIDPL